MRHHGLSRGAGDGQHRPAGRRLRPAGAARSSRMRSKSSKAVNAPVKVIWSREDDLQHGFLPSGTYTFSARRLMQAATTAGWRIAVVGGLHRATGARPLGNGVDPSMVEGAEPSLCHPQLGSSSRSIQDVGVPIGFWRSVGSSQNAFITETFIDELAAAEARPRVPARACSGRRLRHKGVLGAGRRKAVGASRCRRALSRHRVCFFFASYGATWPRSRSRTTAKYVSTGWCAPSTAGSRSTRIRW